MLSVSAITTAIALQDIGAAFAKSLFVKADSDGMIALRLSLAALILFAIRRPWRTPPPRHAWAGLLIYGLMIGAIGVLLYRAFALIPLGVAVGIQALGPLTIALLASRRPRDLAWFTIAVAGLWLLLPIDSKAPLNPVGVGYALASATCWAIYVLGGKHVSHLPGPQTVPWGLLIGSLVTLPLGIIKAGNTLLSPGVLEIGLLTAILSSVIPNTLEMIGMRHMPHKALGILLSSAPAFAALAGFFVLGERLSATQCVAILLVMLASAGSAFSS